MVKVNKDTVVKWDAQEYVQRDKNAGWYVALVLVGVALVALSIWLRQWTFTALVVLSVVALVLYSVRPPRVLHYELSDEGLAEGKRLYSYADYKSFGVVKDGAIYSIVLTPKKRFSPRVTVYFPQDQGEMIVDMFGVRMPMEEVKMDLLDKLIKFLRI